MYLKIQNNGHTKTYTTTNAYPGPKLAVEGGYIPLTTSTTNGLYIKANIGGVEHRAMEFMSRSESGTFLTTAVQSEGLSSVTALTRESISGYATRESVSGYETRQSVSGYETRSSTSATLTRSSTSATLTRSSTSATLTRSSTSATLTRSSTSATLTRSSTSATYTRSSISGYGTRTNGHTDIRVYNMTEWRNSTGLLSRQGTSIAYQTASTMYGLTTSYNVNGYNWYDYFATFQMAQVYVDTQYYTYFYGSQGAENTGLGRYTQVTTKYDWQEFTRMTGYSPGYTWVTYADYNSTINNTYTSVTQSYRYGTETTSLLKTFLVEKGLTYSETTATLTRSSASGYGTRSSISGYGTRSSVSGYGTRSSISGYGTRSSISGYGTRSSISGYGTRVSTSATLTRASTSATLTRVSTSATLTCASTSAYSGVSSSSFETSGWQ